MSTIYLLFGLALSKRIQGNLTNVLNWIADHENKNIPSICEHFSNKFAIVNRREKDDVVREPVAIYPSLCTTAQGIYYSRPIPHSATVRSAYHSYLLSMY